MSGLFTLTACTPDGGYHGFSGPTMGTSYRVTVSGDADCTPTLSKAIEAELQRVSAQMSTWLPDSEVSRFNAAPAGEWVPVSGDLVAVAGLAQDLARLSEGAFDITAGPLVNLWGFGVDGWVGPPSKAGLENAMARVGHQWLEARQSPPALRKRLEGLRLDLSAIAKGHGVDRLADLLESRGCTDYLIDIGGEVRVRGVNPRGTAWRIAIDNPATGRSKTQHFIRLSEGALATSGDYRNFRFVDGERLSHTIDPRTGRPVTHGMASVTVVAETAALADGLSTLINVLGPETGLKFAEQQGIGALALVRRDGGFDRRYTAAMREHLDERSAP